MANNSQSWTVPSTFPPKPPRYIEMTGVQVMGYTVIEVCPMVGNEARWKIRCMRCARIRVVTGTLLRRAQSGESCLGWCECGKHEFDTSLVEERLDVSPKDARVLVAVVAYERAFGHGVARKALVEFCDHEPQTLKLQRRGLIVYTGHPAIITASIKTWKAMRPEEKTQK